ncbi:MAG: radical SAM protein [Marinifilaceae bacterium]
MNEHRVKNILFVALPFWDPLIPPQGIAHLKNYLKELDYQVNNYDFNVCKWVKDVYEQYFNVLKDCIPDEHHGNFYNIGHDVLRNHMLIHLAGNESEAYYTYLKDIVYKTYYHYLTITELQDLNGIIDSFFTVLQEEIRKLYHKYLPDMVGVSVMRDNIAPSLFVLKQIKEMNPDVVTVMGGSIFSDQLRLGSPNLEYFTANTPYIDKVFIGEGQVLIHKFLSGELNSKQKVYSLKDVNGEILGYSDLNFPDMTDFDVRSNYMYLAMNVSNSCPYKCSFCNVADFFGKYREKDPGLAAVQMERLYHKYGIRTFFMNDSLLNYVADDFSTELQKLNVPLYWDGYLRVADNVCIQENTIHWRNGGFYRARLGVESGSQNVLRLMGKEITIDQTKAALKSLGNAGIKTTTYWVIGHPGETEEDFQLTLKLLEELKSYIYEAECNPFIFSFDGQSSSDKWQNDRKLLYPNIPQERILIQDWTNNSYPLRNETYSRVYRFVQRCNELEIPNPYSYYDIYNADNRWNFLHRNAVPSLVDIYDDNFDLMEARNVRMKRNVSKVEIETDDFDF